MTKHESCARALYAFNAKAMVVQPAWDQVSEQTRNTYRGGVDAIFAELAEPDEAMLKAGRIARNQGVPGDPERNPMRIAWQAMLRATAGGGDG